MGAVKEILDLASELVPENLRSHVDIVSVSENQKQEQISKSSIAICSQLAPHSVVNLAIDSKFGHICQSNGKFFNHEVSTAANMIASPQNFLNFPLAVTLNPQNINSAGELKLRHLSTPFNGANEKETVLKSLKSWVETISKSNSFVGEVLGIADELFMNAVYNAPFINEQGKREDIGFDDERVRNGLGKSGCLFAGAYDGQLVIGCSDQFGSLNIEKLLNGIKGCFDKGVAENMNFSTSGGAGIGSFLVFNSGVSYYVGVEKGQRTVVCCKLPLGMSSRKRDEEPKNLSFFVI